ncbi:two-component sensor histidine kinase [Chromobacterium sp. ATCC 53434]|uniref:sensor histidine kinase n=1 Tax=Chromobacterium TaxID=535 RepID=UPI000C77B2B3|nr:ATP-binding protein [Chromobacterium sp. ATCC 53434]AUH49991.1 two-component sensor histidine kinase [Chromobacterium sp. ATCC 53434]
MDGFKRRLSESVQLRLSFALTVAILLFGVVAGVFSFASALDEAHEFQDDVLRQVAALLDRERLPADFPEGGAQGGNEESRVIVQRLGSWRPAAPGVDAGGVLRLEKSLPDGLQTVETNGESFRVLVRTMKDGQRIAVAQEAGFRDELARDGALRTVMPFLLLVPLLLLMVAKLVRGMFRPIAELSREVDQRAEQQLHPLDPDGLPMEIKPFVLAINRLLERVAQSMRAQRRFVADAAHELRSPLTALSLQAERLADAEMSEAARERLSVLRGGIARGRNLLDQLLALARAQSATAAPSAVSVTEVYRRVLEDLMPLAEARHIDIGVEGGSDAWVWAAELDLFTLLRNLADNAIRYTPAGGRVDLAVGAADGRVLLTIDDTGPGIPRDEWERVFDPFYRSLGSGEQGAGLGLSIVRTIAERIGARVSLSFRDEAGQSGLRVSVSMPAARGI